MPFRNLAAVPLPASLAIPTCDKCGSEWIDQKTAKAIDVVLSRTYAVELQKRLDRVLDAILSTDGVTQRRLEQLLGLSVGYLSRVRAGRGEPSAQLVSALALIAMNPKRRISELAGVWEVDS